MTHAGDMQDALTHGTDGTTGLSQKLGYRFRIIMKHGQIWIPGANPNSNFEPYR